MNKRIVAFAIAFANFLSPAFSQPSGDKISVSCTTNGQVIYKDDLPISSTFEHRKKIIDSFPHAMCVFLTKNSPETISSSFDEGDAGLVAALAAIAGGKTGEKYPAEIGRVFSQDKEIVEILGKGSRGNEIASDAEEKTSEDGYVNLTLGVYREMKMEDILAHWRLMQDHGSTLSKLIPVFDIIDDVTVLSIMDVPDTIADKVCTEAAAKGQGCIAFF